ncbi:MAG: RNA polymerase sigma factor FliA [Francisellaceae bacterium]|nr:RNA polymerase sigma factor FliA [Francisellaceae bacterium]
MSQYEKKINLTGMVKKHSVLVKRIAHHLLNRLPSNIQIEDLIQSGMIGLIEAANNFKDDKGASFETYAGIRIRGAMLDEVRKGDWTPRSVHKNSRMITKAIKDIENNTGRDARDIEVAKQLGISMHEYHQLLVDTTGARLFGYEEYGITTDMISEKNVGSGTSPLERTQRAYLKKDLTNVIGNLPKKEKLVLTLYYDEDLNFKEVGEVLGVSESRISQLHSQAMFRIKARMNNWREH